MKIYLASSWRNPLQPDVVVILRSLGHEVYDFRNPRPGDQGFSWEEISVGWKSWTVEQYREALQHPVAQRGHHNDMEALEDCDACVLLLPAGRSAAWELGWAMARGKAAYVVMDDSVEPELMFRGAQIAATIGELADMLGLGGAR